MARPPKLTPKRQALQASGTINTHAEVVQDSAFVGSEFFDPHDLVQVRAHFPFTLLLARELVAFGPTAEVLSEANWASAQRMQEPFDEDAPLCAASPDLHTHKPAKRASA